MAEALESDAEFFKDHMQFVSSESRRSGEV